MLNNRDTYIPSDASNEEYVLDGGHGDAGGDGDFNPLTNTVKKKSYAAI